MITSEYDRAEFQHREKRNILTTLGFRREGGSVGANEYWVLRLRNGLSVQFTLMPDGATAAQFGSFPEMTRGVWVTLLAELRRTFEAEHQESLEAALYLWLLDVLRSATA